ncbi:MAG TPA: hypothetical protein VGG06_26040 [Thermoanaerobaculia bacterium]
MRRSTFVLLAAAFLVAAGCGRGPQVEFADWLFPIAPGTPIKEYGPVPLEGRDTQVVQLIDDLVIGDDVNQPDAILYQPTGIVVSGDGTIFVGDRGAGNVKMFAPDGSLLKTFGKEGQGPGEFGRIGTMTIAAGKLIVDDSRNRRYSVWTLDGEHVADEVPTRRVSLSYMHGLADGTLVGYTTERDEDRNARRVVMRRTLDGNEVARLFETPAIPPTAPISISDRRAMLQDMIDSFDDPRIYLEVWGGEVLYLSPQHEYQVLAMSTDGDSLWALRVAWARLPYPESQKQSLVDSFMRSFPGDEPVRPDQLDWPEHAPALLGISTDAAGHIYVFPTLPPTEDPGQPRDEWAVDVYTPAGDFIGAGVVPYRWSWAQGDFVYGTRPNELDETVVVRYRLVVSGS